MKRVIPLLLLILLLPAAAAQAAPVMLIPESRITQTTPVAPGEPAVGVFSVFNHGDEDLVINSVTPG